MEISFDSFKTRMLTLKMSDPIMPLENDFYLVLTFIGKKMNEIII